MWNSMFKQFIYQFGGQEWGHWAETEELPRYRKIVFKQVEDLWDSIQPDR